jgi:hypothetical protein
MDNDKKASQPPPPAIPPPVVIIIPIFIIVPSPTINSQQSEAPAATTSDDVADQPGDMPVLTDKTDDAVTGFGPLIDQLDQSLLDRFAAVPADLGELSDTSTTGSMPGLESDFDISSSSDDDVVDQKAQPDPKAQPTPQGDARASTADSCPDVLDSDCPDLLDSDVDSLTSNDSGVELPDQKATPTVVVVIENGTCITTT